MLFLGEKLFLSANLMEEIFSVSDMGRKSILIALYAFKKNQQLCEAKKKSISKNHKPPL